MSTNSDVIFEPRIIIPNTLCVALLGKNYLAAIMAPHTTPLPLSSAPVDPHPRMIDDGGFFKDTVPAEAIISGGGIAGLVLALALQKHVGIVAEVYEQASGFADGVGGAIGMYANGLRVLRDIDPSLLSKLREGGYPYLRRRWYRHDGTEVANGDESKLSPGGEEELTPLGIRRWKLQRALIDACSDRGIPVHFGRKIDRVVRRHRELVEIEFSGGLDGSSPPPPRLTRILFGCDGVKSRVRDFVVGSGAEEPEYTGVTCLMGSAPIPSPSRGICFPSSTSTGCHMCTYPTGPNETIFQMYFPTPEESTENWGTFSEEGAKEEIETLADKMVEDGWSQRFVNTVRACELGSLVRVGLRAREPISRWFDDGNNVVLLGDAAHPPVPYIGQGAMMAIEDAGTLAVLLKELCCMGGEGRKKFSSVNVGTALHLYQEMRIPRTRSVLGKSKVLGKTQQDRADSWMYNLWREMSIKLQVALNGSLPIMLEGVMYDYRAEAKMLLLRKKSLEKEEGGEAENMGTMEVHP